MQNFLITKDARSDLNDIWFHIAVDNIKSADDLEEKLISKMELIGEFPEIGRTRNWAYQK